MQTCLVRTINGVIRLRRNILKHKSSTTKSHHRKWEETIENAIYFAMYKITERQALLLKKC